MLRLLWCETIWGWPGYTTVIRFTVLELMASKVYEDSESTELVNCIDNSCPSQTSKHAFFGSLDSVVVSNCILGLMSLILGTPNILRGILLCIYRPENPFLGSSIFWRLKFTPGYSSVWLVISPFHLRHCYHNLPSPLKSSFMNSLKPISQSLRFRGLSYCWCRDF